MTTKVLVIDDSASVGRQVRDALEPAGFEVQLAHDGPSGMIAVRSVLDLDIVFLDYNMPGMNGLSLLQWIESGAHPNHPHVVMMTTESAPSLMQRAKALGAKSWLVKPVDGTRVLAVARSIAAIRSKK